MATHPRTMFLPKNLPHVISDLTPVVENHITPNIYCRKKSSNKPSVCTDLSQMTTLERMAS